MIDIDGAESFSPFRVWARGGQAPLRAQAIFLCRGDPVNVYPFIEAEKVQRRNVKRACELLKVSCAAYYAARTGQPPDRDRQDAGLTRLITAERKRSKRPVRRAADPCRAAPPGPAAFP